MKILFITSRFPFPLEKGDKLRAFNFIKCLSQQHEIHLFAITENKPSPQDLQQLQPYCSSITTVALSKPQIVWNLFKACFTQLPFQVSYFTFGKAQAQLRSLQQKIQADAAFFHLIRTAELTDSIGNIPAAIDYMDTFSVGIKRRIASESILTKWLWKWEYHKLLHYEAAVFSRFRAHTIISEQDRSFLPIIQKENITVIPNGVTTHPLQTSSKKYQIIFAGNMNYPPNIEAVTFLVKKIMPLVWQKIPDAKVVIAGAEPAAAVQKLANPKVEVTGWVNNIQEYFLASQMLVAPMLTSIGLQNKLLEAMALGIPCVTSGLANNALQATPGKQILVANDAETFAVHIVNLLENKELEDTISNEAYRFVLENYSWKKVAHSLNKLLEVLKKQ